METDLLLFSIAMNMELKRYPWHAQKVLLPENVPSSKLIFHIFITFWKIKYTIFKYSPFFCLAIMIRIVHFTVNLKSLPEKKAINYYHYFFSPL